MLLYMTELEKKIMLHYKRAVKVAAECGLVKVSLTKIAEQCGCTVTHVARVIKGNK